MSARQWQYLRLRRVTMLSIRPVCEESSRLLQGDYRRDCCLSHSRVASFRRVCQLFPVALSARIISSSNRTVVGTLVGFFCGPRNLRRVFCKSSGSSEKDMEFADISGVHSMSSSSIISGLGFLSMSNLSDRQLHACFFGNFGQSFCSGHVVKCQTDKASIAFVQFDAFIQVVRPVFISFDKVNRVISYVLVFFINVTTIHWMLVISIGLI